jgi:hypothetical protein
MNIEELRERYPNSLLADGFDAAIIGVESLSGRVVYSVDKVLDMLMEQDMEFNDALEYFEYNMQGAYVGELTPIWCWPVDERRGLH